MACALKTHLVGRMTSPGDEIENQQGQIRWAGTMTGLSSNDHTLAEKYVTTNNKSLAAERHLQSADLQDVER